MSNTSDLYKRVLECPDKELDLQSESGAPRARWRWRGGALGWLRPGACVRKRDRRRGRGGHREGAGEWPVRPDDVASWL
jgi:hypothetical protein